MRPRFSTVLIANRGEIACRIIRAAHAEGCAPSPSTATPTRTRSHVRLADAAVRIGPAAPAQSYLSAANVIAAAKAAGAEAIHPGYGFLAENADFAESAGDAGLVFVGPPPPAIRAMGDKSAAKARMRDAGVPCAPGYHGEDQSAARFAEEAARDRLSRDGEGERRRRRARHARRSRDARNSPPALRRRARRPPPRSATAGC